MLALECFCWLFSTEFPAIITATARYCGCSRAAASQGQPANRAPSRLPLHLCYDLARIWSNDDLGTRCEHRQRNELYQVCPIGAVELKCRQPNKNEAIPLPRRGHRVRATTSHPPLQFCIVRSPEIHDMPSHHEVLALEVRRFVAGGQFAADSAAQHHHLRHPTFEVDLVFPCGIYWNLQTRHRGSKQRRSLKANEITPLVLAVQRNTA